MYYVGTAEDHVISMTISEICTLLYCDTGRRNAEHRETAAKLKLRYWNLYQWNRVRISSGRLPRTDPRANRSYT